MRKLMLGMLLAAGAALPTMAAADADAQDRPPEAERHHDHGDGSGQPHQERQEQPRAQQRQQQPRPQPAPQAQAQAQAQVQARGGPGGGGYRGYEGGRFDGGQRRFDRVDRSAPPAAPQSAERAQGGPAVAPGSGGYRAQGDPRFAPGSGGYRSQENLRFAGPGGYHQQGGPSVAPGSGGYRAQGGPGYRPAPPSGHGGSWNRGWRENRQFDYGRYRAQNNYLYRLPHYYAPAGWGYGYRRFSPGIALSSVLFAEDYWIDDPYYYRLPPAYEPYRWVRYYNDALLIDLRSGVVVDVVHDIFW